MPTPPLSPTPRRWRSSPDNPHPDFAALLSTFEPGSTASAAAAPSTEPDSRSSASSWATPKSRHTAAGSRHRDEDDENAVEYMTATESEHKARSTASTSVSRARTPDIRTTSPSPQRPAPSARSDMSLSPLMPPSRSQLFGDDASATGARADATRDPYQIRPAFLDRTESSYSSRSHTPTHPIPPQITGQSTRSTRSTNTIDAAYDGVLSTLDALANPSFLIHSRGASDPGPASSLSPTSPAHSPATSAYTPTPLSQPLVGLGNRLPDAKALFATDAGTQPSRLSTVSERSERSSRSAHSDSVASPTNIPGAWHESRTDHSAASVASRYPLPPSPVKPSARSPAGSIGAASGVAAAPATGAPQATPKKTSDLIKMFESRATPGSEPLPPVPAQPVFMPATPSRTMPKAASGTGTPLRSEPLFSPPTCTVGAATTASTAPAVPPTYSRGGLSPAPYAPPSPPPKSPSPLSQVRTMIASWRTRAGSPSFPAASPGTGSTGKDGRDGSRLFGRGGDRGWNVSIRRRRRNERELAERGDEAEHPSGDRHERQPKREREVEGSYAPEYAYGQEQGRDGEEKKVPSRASSHRSERKTTSEPKQFTGEPIRTGALYYLNVHDDDLRPNFEWVQADGRLYNEGLELSWTSARGRATVTLDLEFCDEVASTYSPNNPMAGEDIGAAAARRQGDLADSLYPFKLVYDDGVERLACDSARDRVRWVNAIWTVLEHTRAPAMPRTASLRANRSISEHGSDAGGSASTHFTPGADRADHALSHPSPLGSSHSHPLYTTDDAVVETPGGGHAPLVQRGSRRLAVGGLERNRSLRRVASEADLRESAADPPPLPEKYEDRRIQDIPLTAENAQRPLSRDFQFAFGTRPPTLADESERGFFSPPSGSEALSAAYRTPATAQVGLTPATGYHSLDASSAYRSGVPASERAYTAQAGPASAWDAQSMYTARPPTERATPVMTARGVPSEPALTAHSAHTAPTAYTGPASWDSQSGYSARPPAAEMGEGRQRQYTVAMGMGLAPEAAGSRSDGTQTQSQYGTNSSSTVTRFGFPLTESSNFSSSASQSQAQIQGQGAPAPPAPAPATAAAATAAAATAAAATAAYHPSTASVHTAQHPATSMGTAQPFTHSPSAATAQQPSEAGTADMFSPSISSHSARQPTTLAQTAIAGTAQPGSVISAHTAQGPATPARMAGEHTDTAGMWTPQGTGAYGIPQVAVTGASPSQPSVTGSGGAGTAPTASRSAYTDALGPRSANTGLGAPQSAVASAQGGSQSYQTATGSYFGTAHGTGAGGGLGSLFQSPPVSERDHPTSRMIKTMSEASYQSAPPPVPSRDSHYSTASPGSATASIQAPRTRTASPARYQLHDAPVPTYERSVTEGRESYATGLLPSGQQPQQRESTYYGTVDGDNRSAYQSRPPTTYYATARTDPRTAPSVGTAPTSPSRSPRSSEWDTAPPPPISHDSRESRDARSEKQSTRYTDGLGSRRGSRAWTQVSHPDEDDEMLAELERRSSSGSSASHVLKGQGGYAGTAGTPSRTMWTTQSMGDGKESTRTPLGTARENTMYDTARESAYTGAGSWETQVPSTYVLTVPGSQTYFTAQTLQGGPIRAQAPSTQAPTVPSDRPISDGPAYEKPISISTASTVPSPRKIPRVPPPVMPYAPMVQENNPPPPSPSVPSVLSSSHQTSEPTTASSSSESSLTVRAENTDVNRILNFLQGQEMAKTGQTTRIGNQLDRIERKVTQMAENQSALASRDQPPPVPSKEDEDDEEEQSMPSSPTSSTSSLETARPVTPPPLIIPEVINQQFDDLRNLLGTLIGRQEDLLSRQDMMARELERKRSFDVELPDRGPGMSRLEDLLKRVLQRVGDSEFEDEYARVVQEERRFPASVATPRTEGTRDGSMYEGGESVYSGEFNARGRQAPANSITSEQHRRRHGPPSDIPESLLDGELPSPEFDDEWAIANLPPDTPPREFMSRQSVVPPRFARQTPRQAPQMATPAQQPVPQSVPLQHQPIQEYPEEEYYEEEQDEPITEEYEPSLQPEPEHEPTPVPVPREVTPQESPIQPPVPYRTEDDYQDQQQPYSDDVYNRGPVRQGPPPQPVNLPTPVNSPRTMPPYQPQPQMMSQGMRPPFPGPGMPPMAPGMSDMPRPSLPRIAGVRDPISTTYFRRGFPPGPMGMPPMGMFPGPMGVPGPGMGPFMPGLRPGMSGFGGPIGPNVNPSLRRPGFFPPGVAGTTGDYGLPAAARYGNGPVPPGGAALGPGPPRPAYGSGQTTTADTGLDITSSEPPSSTTGTPSTAGLTELRTPVAAPATHFNEPVEVSATTTMAAPTVAAPSSEMGYTDDGVRRTLDNTQALAAAQGDQQNEMSRYLHGMSDQIADGTLAAQNQLAEIMGDIAALREQLKPKHVHAHVLPDGTVMLENGDIIDGIRGVPAPVPAGVPPPPPPPVTAPHVEGKILPDGTVMVGGKIVDGIRGAPTVATPATPAEMLAEQEPSEEDLKNEEQDKKLAELSDKIAELMARSAAPPVTIFEEEEAYSIKADTASPAPDPTALLTTPAPAPAPTTFGPGPSFVSPPASSTISKTKSVLREREIVREGPNGKTKEVVFEETEEAVGESNRAGSAPPISVVPPSGVESTPLVAATLPPGTVIVTGAGTVPAGTVAGTGAGTAPPGTVAGTGTAPAGTVAPGPGSVAMGDPPATGMSYYPPTSAAPTADPVTPAPSARINPRTGKPISMPPTLAPTPFSPIKSDYLGDGQSSHLIREEHEEIIQHPGGGPPIHTFTTSRTHTQLPPTAPVGSGSGAGAGSGGSTGASNGGPPATVFADPHKSATAPGTVPPVSVHPPSSAAPPPMATTAPGVHFSDHQSVVEQGPPNIPATTSVHESKTVAPGPIPIDTANTSVSQTRQPPATVANVAPTGGAPSAAGGAPAPPPKAPSNVAANVPTAGGPAPSAGGAPAAAPSAAGPGAPVPSAAGAPAPSVAGGPAPGSNISSNAKPPAQVWDANHAKSPKPGKATELSNVPATPSAGGAGGPTGDPVHAAQNVPSAGAGGPSGAPAGGAVVPPPATGAGGAPGNPAPPAGSKPKSGVHWNSMVPIKGMSDAAGRSPKATAAAPSPATDLVNVPVVNDPSGGGTAGGIPASSVHEVARPDAGPSSGAAPGSAVGGVPGAAPGGAPGSATNAAKDSHKGSLSGILRKPKSQENIKSSTTQPGGGLPMVPADITHHPDHSTVGKPTPAVGGGKDTRVSDTAHVSGPPTMGQLANEGRDLTAYPGGQTVHVPAQPTASGPSNKLRKQPPQLGPSESSMADPRNLAGNMAPGTISQPGSRAPSAAHPGDSKEPVVLELFTLPDGRTAYVKSNPPSVAGSHAGRAGGATPKPVPAPDAISGVPLPADAFASAPPPGARPPSALKKGKGVADEPGAMVAADAAKEAKAPGAGASAASGHGANEPHCSVCCPHGARLPQGVPIEACAHQDGPLGAIATGGKPATPSGPRSQQKSGGHPSRPPSVQRVHTPEAEGAGEGEAVMMGDGAPESGPKSAPGSKLSKGKRAPSDVMSPEDAMEDARKLAVRQKAAAEQAASEKAEKDAKHAEKEAKKKAADERHLQNVKALEGLQKLLETIAADQRTERAASDDKITKVIEKWGVTDEEAKKKQAAEDKKSTQATLDAIAKFGKEQGEFLRKLGADIMSQNSDQHKKTQDVTKANAREQVGFNLAGYLDDFSKALSGEVRTLLKEVGDLRESRRALYMELAELLLMKHRQSAGDLMGILPYPAIAAKNMPKKDEKKPDGKPKNPAGPPAWAGWAPMMPPSAGRPLPQPGMPPGMSMSMGGGMVPPPPPLV